MLPLLSGINGDAPCLGLVRRSDGSRAGYKNLKKLLRHPNARFAVTVTEAILDSKLLFTLLFEGEGPTDLCL